MKTLLTAVVLGVILVSIPVLTPLFLTILSIFRLGRPVFDYMLSGELFLLALTGFIVLSWTAFKIRRHGIFILTASTVSCAMLFTSQLIILIAGIISGESAPSDAAFAAASVFLIGYTVLLPFVAIGGILMAREILRMQ